MTGTWDIVSPSGRYYGRRRIFLLSSGELSIIVGGTFYPGHEPLSVLGYFLLLFGFLSIRIYGSLS